MYGNDELESLDCISREVDALGIVGGNFVVRPSGPVAQILCDMEMAFLAGRS